MQGHMKVRHYWPRVIKVQKQLNTRLATRMTVNRYMLYSSIRIKNTWLQTVGITPRRIFHCYCSRITGNVQKEIFPVSLLPNSSEIHAQAYRRPADGILSMLQYTLQLLLYISQYIRSVRQYTVFEMRSSNVAACLAVRGFELDQMREVTFGVNN
jgi:hypothetical protein